MNLPADDVVRLLLDLDYAHVSVTRHGDRLKLRGPDGVVPATLVERARQLKPELLRCVPEASPANVRAWAQWDGRHWHGVAVGAGWWQWCGQFPTLTEALQAAERVKP